MSVIHFYNAVTPGSSLGHGVGRGVYTLIDKKEICSQKMLDEENLPTQSRQEKSVLNEVILSKRIYVESFRLKKFYETVYPSMNLIILDPKRRIVDL